MEKIDLKELAKQKRADGWAYSKVARLFNNLGYRTAYGKKWSAGNINNLLGGRISNIFVEPVAKKEPKSYAPGATARPSKEYFDDVLNSDLRAETKRALLKGMVDWIV